MRNSEEDADRVEFSDDLKPSIEFLNDVSLELSFEIGVSEVTIGELIQWKAGKVLTLDKRQDEPFDIRVNGKVIGRGEPIIVNEKYGVRVTAIIDSEVSNS